jgi:hypothetical protein
MSGAEDPERDRTGPHTDRNPGALPGDATAAPSGARTRSGEPPPGSDTLLSVPAPATREDLEHRLAAVERRLEELLVRLEILERLPQAPARSSEPPWWPWLVFLAGLALAWQIFALFR